ncbi:MAG: efflux RND transporter periplasmic adaptor subunit, partial [Nevskiales bacterium]
LGSVVQPGSELFRLVRQGRIEWRAELTAEQLSQVRIGQKARIRLPDGKTAEGTVRMLSPTLDSSSRKALAYIDLAAGSAARAGMFAQGEILFGTASALTVPHTAVLLRDGMPMCSNSTRIAASRSARCRPAGATAMRWKSSAAWRPPRASWSAAAPF